MNLKKSTRYFLVLISLCCEVIVAKEGTKDLVIKWWDQISVQKPLQCKNLGNEAWKTAHLKNHPFLTYGHRVQVLQSYLCGKLKIGNHNHNNKYNFTL